MFCLAMAAGMLIWGHTILRPHLSGLGFLLYWAGCFAFTFGAIVLALLDARAVVRRARAAHRELVERTLADMPPREADPPLRPEK